MDFVTNAKKVENTWGINQEISNLRSITEEELKFDWYEEIWDLGDT